MTDTTLAQARAALQDVVPSLVALMRSVPDATSVSVGTWTVGDVAAHLSHVFASTPTPSREYRSRKPW